MKNRKPLVGIVMGSDSDLPVMKEAAEALEGFGIAYEISVISAHRNPRGTFDYASKAKSRGIKVLIAGAGGAAHLPGVIAALTPLPVIGVPVKTSKLSGLDSLLSIVQMPDGIPVVGPSATADGVFHQFGFSTHGFQLGPGTGAMMAELVATGSTNVPIDGLGIGRFSKT